MTRRSYDQYCPIARALDTVGDRWALLIVRELLAGPRRYTGLHADLPGVSTDILAARLKDLEREDVVTRRKLPPPAAVHVYELTDRGRRLLPLLAELAAWGASDLAEPRPTDAVRAHWFAVPLLRALAAVDVRVLSGEIDVRLPEDVFHLRVADGAISYADGAAPAPVGGLVVSGEARLAITRGEESVGACIAKGTIEVVGPGPLTAAFSAAGTSVR